MQTIETRVNVDEDRKVTIQLPDSISPGEYDVVLVLNKRIQTAAQPSIQAAQSLLRQFAPEGQELSTELIQERRAERLNE